MAQKTTLREFEAVFPKLEAVILEHAKKYNLPEEYLSWYQKVKLCCRPLFSFPLFFFYSDEPEPCL